MREEKKERGREREEKKERGREREEERGGKKGGRREG